MDIEFNPKQLTRVFLIVVAALTTLNVVTLFFYFTMENEIVDHMVELFDFAIEHNVPTFYSAIAILFCSALLAIIARANWHKEDGSRYYWIALSLMFLFLAFDEAVAIHEMLGSFLERYLSARGYLYYLWVVHVFVVVLVLVLVTVEMVVLLQQ